jgi:hypothetical protein
VSVQHARLSYVAPALATVEQVQAC